MGGDTEQDELLEELLSDGMCEEGRRIDGDSDGHRKKKDETEIDDEVRQRRWRRTSGVYILTYCHVADIFDCFAKRTTNCARETNAAPRGWAGIRVRETGRSGARESEIGKGRGDVRWG